MKILFDFINLQMSTENTCPHDDIIDDNGIAVCISCGEQILDKDKLWKASDKKKYNPDINRVAIRKVDDMSIRADIEGMGFSEEILNEAHKIYENFVNGEIYRGNKRKSIIYACVYYAFKRTNTPISSERLIHIFKLNKKSASEGFKYLNLSTEKNSDIRSPNVIIEETMQKFSASREQIDEVIELYQKIKNKSTKLNSSRPQSVACGLVFYWISQVRKNTTITLKEFTKNVSLSSLTIQNIAKDIEIILEKQNIDKYLAGYTISKEEKKDIGELFALVKKTPLTKNAALKENIVYHLVSYWLSSNDLK